MKIVILGAGQVGASVAESLVSEQNDITVVDIDGPRLRALQDRLDLRTVTGNASHPSVLREAGIEDADLLVAVTQSDETNLVACKLATRMFNVPRRIARVRAADFLEDEQVLGREGFEVDLAICPEQVLTEYLVKLVEFPEALQVLDFANGRVSLVAVRAFQGGPLVGRPISDLRAHMPNVDARIVAIFRQDRSIAPEGATVVEASSGSTAVSEAYFARLLGLPFIAVMPRNTSREKVAQITFHGGRSHFVEQANEVYAAAQQLAHDSGGHYMDQFTYAERATDWRGNNNIAQSMFEQMALERHPVPAWIVVGAGTGGTSATIGRYVRYQCHATRLCVADPEGSVFAAYCKTGNAALTSPGSRIEGIGRPRVEPSFIPTLVDRLVEVANTDSVAAMRVLSTLLGRKVGPSTGTNFVAMLELAGEMRQRGEAGAVLSLLCDNGERYLNTYHDAAWVAREFGDCGQAERRLVALVG